MMNQAVTVIYYNIGSAPNVFFDDFYIYKKFTPSRGRMQL